MKINAKDRKTYRKNRTKVKYSHEKLNIDMEVDYILSNSSVVVASHFGCSGVVEGDRIILNLFGVQIAVYDHLFDLLDVSLELHNKTKFSTEQFRQYITPNMIRDMVKPNTMRIRHNYYS